MKYKTKSLLIGRMYKNEGDDFRTVSIKLFDVNNPHKTTKFPKETLEYPNIEKVKLNGLNPIYYSEGNDIIINDLQSVDMKIEKTTIVITGVQKAFK